MRLILILSFISSLSVLAKAEEMLSFYGSRIIGINVSYKYPLAKVEKLPEWDMKGETPIAFDEAVKAAWKYAETEYPEAELFIEEVELDPRGYPVGVPPEQKKICWVYRFEFYNLSIQDDLPGIVIMLMDGTILEPT